MQYTVYFSTAQSYQGGVEQSVTLAVVFLYSLSPVQ